MSSKINRRMFLKGMGGYTLAIPFLPSLSSIAHAQATSPTLKFSMVLTHFGRDYGRWYPDLTDSQLTATPGAYIKKLSEISGPISHNFGSSFDSVRDKIAILRGLDSMNAEMVHNTSLPTTGCSSLASAASGFGYSIDAVLEESAKFYPSLPTRGALRVCPHPEKTWDDFQAWSFTSKSTPGQGLGYDWSVQNVYNELLNPTNVQAQAARNSKIRGATNLVMENFRQMMNGRRIGSEDKRRLDNYMSLVTEIDKQLGVVAPTCSASNPGSPLNASELHKAMFKMEAAALACGLTKITMHSVIHNNDNPNDVSTWHDVAHGGYQSLMPGSDISWLAHYSKWNMELFAYYLNLLDSMADVNGGTLLDNTLVMTGNEDGSGNHEHYDLPVVVAGAKGKFKTGYFIDYRPRPLLALLPGQPKQIFFAGRPYNGALVTAFKALGLTETDYQKFGLPGFGRYDQHRPDLTEHYRPFVGARVNDTLPFLYTG
ncbi:MAG: DUF1552 domain-containing protein [Bdellovibrionota bacterium]